MWVSHTDDKYPRNGWTSVVEAVVLIYMRHEWRLRQMNAS